MEKENKKMETLILVLGGLVFLAIGLVITFKITEKKEYLDTDIKEAKSNIKKHAEENKEESITFEGSKVEINEDTSKEYNSVYNDTTKKVVENSETIDKVDSTITESKSNTEINNEEKTVNYSNNDSVVINSLENTLEKVKNTRADSKFIDSAKGVFITIVDFLFYDGEISGVSFGELTENGKQEVLKLANKIDNAIEEKAPGYKETISEKASSAFNKASELIKKGANNINDFAKEKLGEEYYNDIIDAKDELVYYTKNAINFIGDVGSNLFNSAKDKLNNWYQNFKNNN